MGAGAIPDEFVCPISGDVMVDPVWLSTGKLWHAESLLQSAEISSCTSVRC